MTARTPGQPDVSQDGPARTAGRSPAPLSPRLRRLPLPVLLALLLVGGLCTLLALNTASAAQELKQRSLTERNAGLSDLQQQLMRDLAAKQAPAALAAAAAAQGLVPNPNPAFLRLNADGSVTVLGSPAAASVAPPPPVATPSAAPTKQAPVSSARPGLTPSSSTRPGQPASTPSTGHAASSSSRQPAPVVTVTVTRPAPAPSASTTKSTAPGGH